jgi:hypothetical protein
MPHPLTKRREAVKARPGRQSTWEHLLAADMPSGKLRLAEGS